MIKRGFILSTILAFWLIFAFFMPQAKKADAQACTAPVAPSSVSVDYPSCSGGNCDLTRASCTWALQGDASSYNVTVTEVETGTIVKNNESQSGTTTTVSFPITQQRTYKCDVVAVAACGAVSSATSDQLLCDADAIIDTPTPSPTTGTVEPTIPPKAVTPTIDAPGGIVETIGIVGGLTLVIVIGVMLFVM